MTQFQTAAVFSNDMVLQRDKNIPVFGYGNEGEEVIISILDKKAHARVINGRWTAYLPPMKAGGPYEMTVTCKDETITFYNVMIGEVWLAGGQSNMEFELQNCTGGRECLSSDKGVNVRYYYTQKNCHIDEKFLADEKNTGWSEFSEESAKCWSAVGYFFAKELSQRLGVTVGIIGCNWGGTSASYWMSRESLERDIDTKEYLDDYDNAIAGKTWEELEKEYLDYVEYDRKWAEKSAAFYVEHPNGSWDECLAFCGPNLYPGPLCPLNPFHATALYDSMVKRVCPYGIRGFIYYQGETDDKRPKTYFKLFSALIRLWREDWGDDELPFLFVQLPMHRYVADPDFKNWCIIREAQTRVYKTIRNTGMAVITDCGEFNEIHPKDKKPVGHRLYLQAMYHVYGDRDIKADGPMYHSHIVNGDKVIISFDNADGFKTTGDINDSFEIAGADKKFITAKAVINPDNTITVTGDGIAEPVYVRYLWTNYKVPVIFGENGIPLSPFRTSRLDED